MAKDLHILDNHLSILKALYFNVSATCLDVSKITGASIPNVAKNINELLKAGYVIESGVGTSSGGRKPVTYSLVASRLYILSVAADQFFTQIGIVDLGNNFVTPIYEFALNLSTEADPTQTLINEINNFIDNSGIPREKIFCAGITMPGFIDLEKGINHSFLKVKDKSIRDHLSEEINIPVFIDNDSSAIALAELKFGAGKLYKDIMIINISWGIGLGMIINGSIFRGSTGFAGEFSHIPLFKNGKHCSCGKIGCLETEASLIIVQDKALEEINKGQVTSIKKDENGRVTMASVYEAAARGDLFAIKLISDAGYNIGQGIAVLIHIMNPSVIVLSGKGMQAGKIWLAPIQQAINEFCIPTLTQETEVIQSSLGARAQLIGASALAIEKISKSFFHRTTGKAHALHKTE